MSLTIGDRVRLTGEGWGTMRHPELNQTLWGEWAVVTGVHAPEGYLGRFVEFTIAGRPFTAPTRLGSPFQVDPEHI